MSFCRVNITPQKFEVISQNSHFMYNTKNDQSKYSQTWAGTLDFSDKSEINQTYNIQPQKLIHECKQITVIWDLHKKKKKKIYFAKQQLW